jgi:hypothetical protein
MIGMGETDNPVINKGLLSDRTTIPLMTVTVPQPVLPD